MATTNLERIQTFFNKLEAQQTLLTTITDLHKTLTNHFTNIEKTLNNKSETIDTHIKTLKENTDNALVNIRNRENALPDRGSSMSIRIAELKLAALVEIEKGESLEDLLSEKSLSEVLKVYCKRMDATGLVTFIQNKRKESIGLRMEIASALESCVDPMRLILDAAEEFVRMKVEGKAILADRRWACDMLIQSVVPLADGGYGAGRSLKERAARVLEKWKGVVGGGDRNSGVCAAEATMILQLIIVFELKERFEEEKFLRKLVLEFANRKDMPKLAVAFGFGNKIGDIIEELVKSSKEVEAVYFAAESGLTERFPSLPLLNSALKNCRRNANNISKKGKFSSAAVDKANSIELDSTKAIIKCVEDHKLEPDFSMEGLKKRVIELEQAKAKKKKGITPGEKLPKKRGRGGGSGKASNPSTSRHVKSGRLSNASPSFRSRNPPQSHQVPPARYTGAHSYTSQSVYEAPSTVSYAPAYGGNHTQSPATLAPQYGYTLQEAGVSGLRSYHGSYGGETGYSAYDYNLTALVPAYPPSYPPQS
ncbi:unnamed protein product [Withania somnifera]